MCLTLLRNDLVATANDLDLVMPSTHSYLAVIQVCHSTCLILILSSVIFAIA